MINDPPSKEVIVETLDHKMMVILGSQPMNPNLVLEEHDEHTEREIPSKTKDVSHSLIEEVMDDVSYFDEDDNKMVVVPTN